MDKHSVDALLCYGEHDFGPAPYLYDNWFTNDRPGTVVVFPRSGDPIMHAFLPLSIVDHMLANRKGESTWIAPKDLRVGLTAPQITATINELGLSKATIGVLGLENFVPMHMTGLIPYPLWKDVVALNPDVKFHSGAIGEDFGRMILKLGDQEVKILRHAGHIGNDMARALVAAAKPGVTEAELMRAAMSAAFAHGTSVPVIHLNSGPDAINWGTPAWTTSPQFPPRTIQEGDVISTEMFGNYALRSTQLQVTVAVGEIHPELERAAKVSRACYEAGLKLLRPGKKFGEVAEAMRKPLLDAGGWSKGPQIHSLNPIFALCACDIDVAPMGEVGSYTNTKWSIPTRAADLVLEPGMSFALEPCCLFGRYGICIGGTVIVGEDEPIELNPESAQVYRV